MDAEKTTEPIPTWALKLAGIVFGVALTGFGTWMTYTTSQINELSKDYAETKANFAAIEKRFDSVVNEESRRYEALRMDMRTFMERIELRLDRLAAQKLGAKGPE